MKIFRAITWEWLFVLLHMSPYFLLPFHISAKFQEQFDGHARRCVNMHMID
jgi:hypothetical protein